MRIKIEIDPGLEEEFLTIHCKELTPDILKLQNMIEKESKASGMFVFYKGDSEYYLNIDSILFFETQDNKVLAHTRDDMFETKYKLYELEKILPQAFVRISKSSIVNTKKIYSINRNLTASSLIEFKGTHKQIFVSRAYYKILKEKMERE